MDSVMEMMVKMRITLFRLLDTIEAKASVNVRKNAAVNVGHLDSLLVFGDDVVEQVLVVRYCLMRCRVVSFSITISFDFSDVVKYTASASSMSITISAVLHGAAQLSIQACRFRGR